MVEPVGLNQKMLEVRAMTDAKGFSADHARIWEMLALIHTEVSEATDAYKKGEPVDHVGEELIDPDTKESLGREEVLVGKARVVSVQPKSTTAELLEDNGVAVGAVLRLPAAKSP